MSTDGQIIDNEFLVYGSNRDKELAWSHKHIFLSIRVGMSD